MRIETRLLLCFLILFVLSSCSHRLVGTWNVEKYEKMTPGEEGMAVSNIGTITFDKNGTGEKNLDYSLLGISAKDVTPFKWSSTENFVTIEGENSEIAKSWIYMENKKSFQKWQSTDGSNNVQTLELAKQ